MSQPEKLENVDPRQRPGRQAVGLAPGAVGTKDGRCRAEMGGRFMPECGLPAQQETKSGVPGSRISRVTLLRSGVMNGAARIDMAKVRERKRAMVDREVALHLNAYKTSGAELIMGSGRFVAPKTLEVQLKRRRDTCSDG